MVSPPCRLQTSLTRISQTREHEPRGDGCRAVTGSAATIAAQPGRPFAAKRGGRRWPTALPGAPAQARLLLVSSPRWPTWRGRARIRAVMDTHQGAISSNASRIVPQVACANCVCARPIQRSPQSSTYAIAANHRRSWLVRMVAVEVRSANRSSWHSLMRFSISTRAQ